MTPLPTEFSILRVLTMTLLIVCIGMLSGCGRSGDDSPTPSPLPSDVSLGLSLGLTLTIKVGSPESPGASIPIQLVLSNPTDATVSFNLDGREDYGYPGTFDFFVTDSVSRQVWNWSHNEGPEQLVLSSASIDPGQQKTFEGTWDRSDNQGQPVPPGTYHVYGIVQGQKVETEPSSQFKLVLTCVNQRNDS